MTHLFDNCNDNGFNNLRFTVVDCLNNVDALTADEIEDLFFEKILDKGISQAASWFKKKASLK